MNLNILCYEANIRLQQRLLESSKVLNWVTNGSDDQVDYITMCPSQTGRMSLIIRNQEYNVYLITIFNNLVDAHPIM